MHKSVPPKSAVLSRTLISGKGLRDASVFVFFPETLCRKVLDVVRKINGADCLKYQDYSIKALNRKN